MDFHLRNNSAIIGDITRRKGAIKRFLVAAMLTLITAGCISKPAPWVPADDAADGADAEQRTGDTSGDGMDEETTDVLRFLVPAAKTWVSQNVPEQTQQNETDRESHHNEHGEER